MKIIAKLRSRELTYQHVKNIVHYSGSRTCWKLYRRAKRAKSKKTRNRIISNEFEAFSRQSVTLIQRTGASWALNKRT